MTYTARCVHGELLAVCRTCPEWTGWPDPLHVDEEPWTVTPERQQEHGNRLAVLLTVAFLALVLLYVLGRPS